MKRMTFDEWWHHYSTMETYFRDHEDVAWHAWDAAIEQNKGELMTPDQKARLTTIQNEIAKAQAYIDDGLYGIAAATMLNALHDWETALREEIEIAEHPKQHWSGYLPD